MSEPRKLIDILKEYFQESQEPLAVEFRKQFAGTGNPLLSEKPGGSTPDTTPLEDWLDNQDVMRILHISPRTLQTLRSNGTLPFSRIGNKLYYKRSDISQILHDNYIMHKLKKDGRNK